MFSRVTRNSCNGKTSYGLYNDAERALSEVVVRDTHRQLKGFRLEVYHCRGCDGWHLGNTRARHQPPEGKSPWPLGLQIGLEGPAPGGFRARFR
jgi:hypothetical protein